ncbi:hypothetical protein H6S82_24745 [Planktothrix sp. FACHB-1355]|uniref:Uncharacterized protein n=1 Tax=Aerosakkonema funiforme FACHB-1375 TaxID=2949571 RepID=A0A926ZHZ9_9CYAN|nr:MULTISPECIES: DUF6232 family protein [Oscillatoriales]MBD2181281.1 hypothetical protein [Aerosakkonema funiforme FACHB-1375]MBD3562030.1 hypothetical protein [Planktothrix sp. FACHB-1355]
MAENKQIIPGDRYTEILEGGTIKLTAKTVQFGSNVFQFHNVTGFGIAKVDTIKIPLGSLFILFIIGLVLGSLPNISLVGGLLVLGAIAGVIYNITQPQRYGLGLYLNSGHMKVFVTTDVRGLKIVVEDLCNYMENNKLGGYVVNIVGGNVTGNYIGGDASGTTSTYR